MKTPAFIVIDEKYWNDALSTKLLDFIDFVFIRDTDTSYRVLYRAFHSLSDRLGFVSVGEHLTQAQCQEMLNNWKKS